MSDPLQDKAPPPAPPPVEIRQPKRWRLMDQSRSHPDDPATVAHLVKDVTTGALYEYLTGPDFPPSGGPMRAVGLPLPAEPVIPPQKLVRHRRRG